jgi:hypothetical protein
MTAATTTLTSGSSSRTLDAGPRFATPRRPERPTFGPQIAATAKLLGTPLMPWQADFADVLGEYDPKTGIPYYGTAFFTVPRQSGKTLLLLAWCLRRCMSQPNQRIVWSGQTGKDARDKWTDELFPMITASKLDRVVKALGRGVGAEKIELRNGSIVRLVSNSDKAGHGKTNHGSAEDEIFADVDNWREQAFGPSMLTVPDSQTLKTSTAGTAQSTIYNNLRRAGRQAVADGADSGLCYLEYSCADDWDYMDESTYRLHMPAVGHTVSEQSIKKAILGMLLDPDKGEEGVLRAYGNRTAGIGEGTIPKAVWERVCSPVVEPEGGLVFGVAVAQDRSSSSIGVGDSSGRLELLENRGGTGWVVERANELKAAHGARVVLDGGGPAGALADQIDGCEAWTGSQVIDAHGAFFDAVVECEGINVRQDTALDLAVEGAVKKMVGDRFVWSRKASTEDVTPLEAVTLAWAGARKPSKPATPLAAMYVGFS